MPQLVALSVSIAVLGAIWAFLALGPLGGFVLVWAGFIGWGCFFHTGGDNDALAKTIAGNVYGVVIAWIALLIIVNVPVEGLGTVWPAIVVGVTVFALVIAASIDKLSAVPAQVYGYAATVAYSLHQATDAEAGMGPLANLAFGELPESARAAHRVHGDRRVVRVCLWQALGRAHQGGIGRGHLAAPGASPGPTIAVSTPIGRRSGRTPRRW